MIKRKIHLPAFIHFALLTLAGNAFGQTDLLNTLPAAFKAYRANVLQEKIFVHTDKPFYLAGEILWCKLYCVEASSHEPLDISRVAYIELLNGEDKPALQGKLLLTRGEGSGSFYLPPTTNSGVYKLRAYTNWMKNGGPDCFFETPITIVNSFKGAQETAKEKATGHIGFYPEGGNLVNGIQSKIAFEMTDAYGKGADGRGWVMDGTKDTLISFRPLRNGIGQFFFTPVSGHTYKAVLQFPDGETTEQALPAAYDHGYTMRVTEAGTAKLRVSVHVSPGAASGDVVLFVHPANAENIALKASLAGDSALFTLDKARLGEGVNQLTLFNTAGQPICERLYGIAPQSQLTIDAMTDQGIYGMRKKVSLSLSATEKNGQLAPASLSMAVYRLDSLQSAPQTNIFTYLWLESELKGRIGATENYLSGNSPEDEEALDNLMLTHGWRRFRWQDILQPAATFLFPPEHNGQLITGRLTDTHTGLPVGGVMTYLTVPGTQFGFASSTTDVSGKMLFDVKDFYGSGGILLQTGTAKDVIYKIEISNPYSEQYSKSPLPAFNRADLQRSLFLEHSISMQVQNIYRSDTINKFAAPAIDSLRFYGHPDYTYKLDDYTRFTTMEEVLREYVREINVNRLHGHLHVLMLDEPVKKFFDDNSTLVILDGIPVPDDKIFAYDPLKVKKLEVIPRQYILGTASFSGIASFTTYKGDYEGLELDPRSLLIDYDGLQLQREFYSPVYETPQQAASRMPDFRNLLFWSPDIHTDAKGKTAFSFYTSDLPGKYMVVVQGLTADGKVGVKYVDFEVK